ncbi:MAG: 50S ribosomal protein L4 [Candidatus Cloacimonetes bacterium]|nr:50S ribosomal protein L4 [Candidatus Cloacimonadota bacterium]
MLEVKKYTIDGKETGTITLPESLFSVETKNPTALFYEVINMYLANQRQGTSSVKTRAEVKGSGRKLFRQKGTGNARPGNLRTPLRVGGGQAFGPKPKNWYRQIPKKKKRLALKLALTSKARDLEVVVVESLNYEKPDTKRARLLIDKIAEGKRKKLILIDGSNKNIIKSFTNLTDVKMNRADSTFAYEVLNANYLILTEDALSKMQEVFVK